MLYCRLMIRPNNFILISSSIMILSLRIIDLTTPQPKYAFLLTHRAKDKLDKNKTESAIKDLKKAVQYDPYHAEANYLLGKIYASTDLSLATPYFKKVIDAGPNYEMLSKIPHYVGYYTDTIYATSCYYLGLWYLQQEQMSLGIAHLKRATTFFTDYIEAYQELGLVYLKAGDIPNAIRESNKLYRRQSYAAAQEIREKIPDLMTKYKHYLHERN
jgi:tetratricopeptide (TPR) repeat protein